MKYVIMRKCKDGLKLCAGIKFNKLTLVEYYKGGIWECLCDCGNIIKLKTCTIKSGNNKSCGCLKKQIQKDKVYSMIVRNTNIENPSISMARVIWKDSYNDGDLSYVTARDCWFFNDCNFCNILI